MTMHTVLRFKTALLNVEQERPNPINPIHGESLLQWLAKRWKGDSPISEASPEDWGWYAYVSWFNRRYMLGASCSDPSEGEREWVLQVVKQRTLVERLFGREKALSTDACVSAIRRLLESEPAFHSITLD
jgi:hypothetical protein